VTEWHEHEVFGEENVATQLGIATETKERKAQRPAGKREERVETKM